MKRCPQCNRLESDDTLAFCRIDGSSLLPVTSEELGTIKFNSGAMSGELLTTMLSPQNTGDASTAETTILPADQSRPITRELKKPRKLIWIAVVAVLIVAVAGVCAYFLLSKKNRPPIQSIAVMPLINICVPAVVDERHD